MLFKKITFPFLNEPTFRKWVQRREKRGRNRVFWKLKILLVFFLQFLWLRHWMDSISGILSICQIYMVFYLLKNAFDFHRLQPSLGLAVFLKKHILLLQEIFFSTPLYFFLIIFKMNLIEIPTVLLHITQRSSFHLFTGKNLTELTHLEMMWKCKLDLNFFKVVKYWM